MHARKLSTPLIAGVGAVLLLLAVTVTYRYQSKVVTLGLPIQASSVSPKGNFAGIRITSALVIGNGKYSNHSVLDNVANDAIVIATAFEVAGYPSVVEVGSWGIGV